MTNTPSTKPAGTITFWGAAKKLVTATAIAGALGLAALGMAGTAAAKPTQDSGSAHSTSSAGHHAESSAPHAESSAPHTEVSVPHAEATSPTGDDVVHAHLIPGVKLVPPAADHSQTAHPAPGTASNPNEIGMVYPSGSIYPNAPDYDPNCGPACYEVIDE